MTIKSCGRIHNFIPLLPITKALLSCALDDFTSGALVPINVVHCLAFLWNWGASSPLTALPGACQVCVYTRFYYLDLK